VARQAYRYIRERVISGAYAPGSRLTEEQLARELGVSRTPVREAVRQLAADGALVLKPNYGIFVGAWSRDEIAQLFDLRVMLESEITALAATNISAGRALIDRGVAADGSAPPGTVALFSTGDRLRNVRAAGFPAVQSLLGTKLQVRILRSDALGDLGGVIALFTGLTSVADLQAGRRPALFRPGAVADITVIDPNLSWKVDVKSFQSKSVNSPFDGWTLQGRAVATIVAGRVKYRLGLV
jgi:DNA-binding transcriptional regulator YhcF (GntR family)